MKLTNNDYKQIQADGRKALRLAYKPKKGFVPNPLLKLSRNAPCPCGSGIKFKRCHLDQTPPYVPGAKK